MTKKQTQQPEDDQTEQIAHDICEDVRRLNHVTAGPPGLTYPGTAYSILGSLSAAAHRLEQTLDQLGRFLGNELDAGRLGHDLGHSPVTEVHRAQGELCTAEGAARTLANALNRAQSAINAVNARPELSPARLASQAFPTPAGEAMRQASEQVDARSDHPSEGQPAPTQGTAVPKARNSR